ncbi:MAG: DUF3810 domain-containing protein [Solobacterium sp.]|nr:DUF3810 domain-containing protein [Solobacterium sp.]
MNRILRKYVCALILLAMNGLGMLLFHRFPGFFFPAYRRISRAWIGFLAQLTSFTRVSVWDILAALLFLTLLFSFLYVLRKHRNILSWLGTVVLTVSVLATFAVYGWMLNHYAPSLAEELGYTIRTYSKQELYDTCEYYLLQAAEYAPQMERDAEGHLIRPDFYALAEAAGSSYTVLGKDHPVFQGSTVRVKRFSLIGEYLMYNGIIGMFMPLSGEASIPASVPTAPMPFTMAHEAAHRLGIASEEEANFAAFLACAGNDRLPFLYSGYYQAFSYCFSSLYRSDPEAAAALYHKYDAQEGVALIQLDRRDTAEVYRSYDSSLQEISDRINDTYLKTFSEESGIRSYGEVTDDLIAWWLANKK